MKKNNSYKFKKLKLAILIPTLLSPSIAHAQWAVIDVAAIGQAILEVQAIYDETTAMINGYLGTSTAIGSQTEAQKNIAQYETQVAHDLAVDTLKTKAQITALDTYGPNSVIAGCNPGQQGADLYQGGQAAMQLRSAMGGSAIDRNHGYTSPSEIIGDLSDAKFVKKEDIIIEKVKPKDYVFKSAEDQEKAKKMMMVATNPAPPLNLVNPAVEETSLAGKKYKEIRKIYDDKALVPTANSMEYIADQSPTIDYGDWAKEEWERMGQGGDYYGVTDGKMSVISAMNLDVISRYENPKFYEEAKQQMNEVWQARQEVLQSAVALKLEWEMYRSVRDAALMQAQNQMDHVNETLGQTLEGLRVDAHKNTAVK